MYILFGLVTSWPIFKSEFSLYSQRHWIDSKKIWVILWAEEDGGCSHHSPVSSLIESELYSPGPAPDWDPLSHPTLAPGEYWPNGELKWALSRTKCLSCFDFGTYYSNKEGCLYMISLLFINYLRKLLLSTLLVLSPLFNKCPNFWHGHVFCLLCPSSVAPGEWVRRYYCRYDGSLRGDGDFWDAWGKLI